jgi:two-component system response regulator DesR
VEGRGDRATAGSRQIGVAIVDDHPAIALALRAAIEGDAEDPPIRFIASARTVTEARELLRDTTELDVLVCDVQLESGLDGLEVIVHATAAGCRAIVLTSFDRSSLMRAAFERGASGFLDKGMEMREVLDAIRRVAEGGTAFSAVALDAARAAPRPPSSREIGVLQELQAGATSSEIGHRLGISNRTVESHLRRLFDRYGVVSRTELTVLAISEGWIEATG